MARTDAEKRAQAKYDAQNMRRYGLKLHKVRDADIIAALDAAESVQGYIKQLVREDIARKAGR